MNEEHYTPTIGTLMDSISDTIHYLRAHAETEHSENGLSARQARLDGAVTKLTHTYSLLSLVDHNDFLDTLDKED